MKLNDLNNKKVMHIDTSCKLYERKTTGIAYKTINSNLHGGLALSLRLKKELERDLNVNKDYAKVYAICIYYLIKDNLKFFDILVICGDERFSLVKKHLELLFKDNKEYLKKEIISIGKLRELTGDKNLKSYADKIARSYRRRALKSKIRQQKGTSLNLVKINYKVIKEKWLETNDKIV